MQGNFLAQSLGYCFRYWHQKDVSLYYMYNLHVPHHETKTILFSARKIFELQLALWPTVGNCNCQIFSLPRAHDSKLEVIYWHVEM